jgi:spore coat protein U-like protein
MGLFAKRVKAACLRTALAALAGGPWLWPQAVLAADSNNIAVSTTVIPICKFNSSTSTLNFVMDPSSTADATASTSLTYWCTKGSTATVTTSNGLYAAGFSPRMRHTTLVTLFLPYTLSLVGATQTGLGKTAPLTLTINGTVLNASYINAHVGTYGDTVTITVSP